MPRYIDRPSEQTQQRCRTTIPPDTYHARADVRSLGGYTDSVHAGISCDSDCPEGDPIAVGTEPLNSIQFAFDSQASLEGTVVDRTTGGPIADADVYALRFDIWGGHPVGSARTDVDGRFVIEHLPADESLTLFATNVPGHLALQWPDTDCYASDCGSPTDWFTLSEREYRTDFALSLASGPSISGAIAGTVPAAPVSARVEVYDGSSFAWRDENQRADHDYQTVALPPGIYYLRATRPEVAGCQWYSGVACSGTDGEPLGNGVTAVTIDHDDVTGIDFVLDNRSVFAHGFER